MKYDIIIKDLNKEEATQLSTLLFGHTVEKETVENTVEKETVENTVENKIQTSEVVENHTPVNNEDLDAEGLPWDERIHSSSHKKKADGTWNRRRGVQPVEFDRIKAELLNSEAPVANPMAEAPVANPMAEAPMANPMAGAPVANPMAGAPVANPMAGAPVANPMAGAPVANPMAGAPVVDVNIVWSKIKEGFNSGTVSQDDVQDLVAELNRRFNLQMTNITAIMDRPDVIATASQLLDITKDQWGNV